jgi:hypothetical protein
MVQRLLIVGCLLAIVIGAAAMLPVTAGSRTVYVCPHCTAQQTRWRYLDFTGQTEESNEFSAWCAAHRPAHVHVWRRASCTRGYSIVGMTTYWGCGDVHPVSLVPPELLLEFATKADEETLDAYFREVGAEDRETQERAIKKIWDTLDRS